jgi:hypothetical protein
MKPLAILFLLAFFSGCKPARSDIFVEKVNPELVNRLISTSANQSELLPDSIYNPNPLWVRGLLLNFQDSTKSTILWYDEQNRITGMVEYQNGKVKDSLVFFQNGQRMFSLLFNSSGKTSGLARFYYEDGRVREDGRYEDGFRTGIWRQFNPDGKLEETHEYDRYGNLKR